MTDWGPVFVAGFAVIPATIAAIAATRTRGSARRVEGFLAGSHPQSLGKTLERMDRRITQLGTVADQLDERLEGVERVLETQEKRAGDYSEWVASGRPERRRRAPQPKVT